MARVLSAVLAWSMLTQPLAPVFAQAPRSGLSPEDEKRRDELMRSAKTNEMIAYVAAGVAVAAIVVGVPISIYFDRKKKARKGDSM